MPRTKAQVVYKPMSFRICEGCNFKVTRMANGEKRPIDRILTKDEKDEHKKFHKSWIAKLKRRLENIEKADNPKALKKAKSKLKHFTSRKDKVFNFR